MRIRSYVGVASLGTLMMLTAGTARASTIVVNSLYDPSLSKHCTLHDAIIAANTGVAVNGCRAGSGNDTIIFYVSGTIVLSETLPEIERTLNVSGPPAKLTISGNNAVQIMTIGTEAVVSLSRLTIADGLVTDSDTLPGEPGGAGIFNFGNLSVDSSTFINNNANASGTTVLGAAIFAVGPLSVSNSSFIRNNATGSVDIATGAAGGGQGGALINAGGQPITVTNCKFDGNTASATGVGNFALAGGGAIFTPSGGLITIKNSTFTNNSSTSVDGPAIGGALDNASFGFDIENSTFSYNSASASGVGAFVYGGAVGNGAGPVAIINSTFTENSASGNAASDVFGGGVAGPGGTTTIFFSTFSKNSATNTGGPAAVGGNLAADSSTIIANSILVGATAGGDCGVLGPFIDGGYNLADDASCAFTATGSKNNTNPKLSPFGLANNGGPTQTIALSVYSPAIDAIPHAACVDASGYPVTMDQRGAPRPDREDGPYGPCDIGAYEFQAQASGVY